MKLSVECRQKRLCKLSYILGLEIYADETHESLLIAAINRASCVNHWCLTTVKFNRIFSREQLRCRI